MQAELFRHFTEANHHGFFLELLGIRWDSGSLDYRASCLKDLMSDVLINSYALCICPA